MPKTRRLSDLYVVGKELQFDDGDGSEPIVVWLQKLNPLESEKASRIANAVRARSLSMLRYKDSEEYQAIYGEVLDLGEHEDLADFLVSEDVHMYSLAVEEELAHAEEWEKENYLQGLRDAWEGGLREVWVDNKEEPEAKRVYEELKRFADKANEMVDEKRDTLKEKYQDVPLEKMQEDAAEKMLKMQADMSWLSEFRRAELWLGVRDPENHKAHYFTSRDEVNELSFPILKKLQDEYASLTVDVLEGKDSVATQASSPSVEVPVEAGTEASSGPSLVPQ